MRGAPRPSPSHSFQPPHSFPSPARHPPTVGVGGEMRGAARSRGSGGLGGSTGGGGRGSSSSSSTQFVITESTHMCGYSGCGKRFRFKHDLLRHQTKKHGRAPTGRGRPPSNRAMTTERGFASGEEAYEGGEEQWEEGY